MTEEVDFEELVIDALDRLPAPYRERLGSVAIVIEDEPSPDQLASVGAGGLFGLYQGVPRTAYGAEGAQLPSKITIFRLPLLRAYRSPGGLQPRSSEDRVSRDRPPFRDQRCAARRAGRADRLKRGGVSRATGPPRPDRSAPPRARTGRRSGGGRRRPRASDPRPPAETGRRCRRTRSRVRGRVAP